VRPTAHKASLDKFAADMAVDFRPFSVTVVSIWMGAVLTERVQQLLKDVQYPKDRQAVLDVIMRQARGHDRHETELMNSCFWDDGVDEHGQFVTPGPEYGDWAGMADPGSPHHDRGGGGGRREVAGQQDLRDLPQGRVGHRGPVVRAPVAALFTISLLGWQHPLKDLSHA
jgi:NAD(P)-dependent dehydrogenase (short-subunit alcohol dehydrogenase family)